MEFLDKSGHIFIVDSYSEKPIGYEFEESGHIFWFDHIGQSFLSINNYYVQCIYALIDLNELADYDIYLQDTDVQQIKDSSFYMDSNPNTILDLSEHIETVNKKNIEDLIIEVNCESNIYQLISPSLIQKAINNISDNNINNYVDLTEFDKNLNQTTVINTHLSSEDNTSDDIILIDIYENDRHYALMPIYVLANSKEEGTWKTNIMLHVANRYNGINNWCPITVGGEFQNQYEELVINGHNMGVNLPPDILKAIYQQSFYDMSFNEELFNEKLKEYLLNYMNIKGNQGNYQSIQNSLNWFGWGEHINLKKLRKTDNQFKSQFLLTNFNILNNPLYAFKYFTNTALLNIQVKLNDLLRDEKGDIIYYNQDLDNKNKFIGEGNPKTYNLDEKYIYKDVGLGTDTNITNKYKYIEKYYLYSINELGLKLMALTYYFKKYFLPIHVNIHSGSLNYKVFSNDIKLHNLSYSTSIAKPIINYDSTINVEFPHSKLYVFERQFHIVDDQFNEFNVSKLRDNAYYLNDTCVSIPINFINLENTNKYDDIIFDYLKFILNYFIILKKKKSKYPLNYNNLLNIVLSSNNQSTLYNKENISVQIINLFNELLNTNTINSINIVDKLNEFDIDSLEAIINSIYSFDNKKTLTNKYYNCTLLLEKEKKQPNENYAIYKVYDNINILDNIFIKHNKTEIIFTKKYQYNRYDHTYILNNILQDNIKYKDEKEAKLNHDDYISNNILYGYLYNIENNQNYPLRFYNSYQEMLLNMINLAPKVKLALFNNKRNQISDYIQSTDSTLIYNDILYKEQEFYYEFLLIDSVYTSNDENEINNYFNSHNKSIKFNDLTLCIKYIKYQGTYHPEYPTIFTATNTPSYIQTLTDTDQNTLGPSDILSQTIIPTENITPTPTQTPILVPDISPESYIDYIPIKLNRDEYGNIITNDNEFVINGTTYLYFYHNRSKNLILINKENISNLDSVLLEYDKKLLDVIFIPDYKLFIQTDIQLINGIYKYNPEVLNNAINYEIDNNDNNIAPDTDVYNIVKYIINNNYHQNIIQNSLDYHFVEIPKTELIYESHFSFVQSDTYKYENFIICPKLFKTDYTYFNDANLILKLNVNNEWFYHQFKTSICTPEIDMGTLEYQFWDDPLNYNSDFYQLNYLDDNHVYFNSYMHEPSLVTVNNSNYINDVVDHYLNDNIIYYNIDEIPYGMIEKFIIYKGIKIFIDKNIIGQDLCIPVNYLHNKVLYSNDVIFYQLNDNVYKIQYLKHNDKKFAYKVYLNYRNNRYIDPTNNEEYIIYTSIENKNLVSDKYTFNIQLNNNQKYQNHILLFDLYQRLDIWTNLLYFPANIHMSINGIMFNSFIERDEKNNIHIKFNISGKLFNPNVLAHNEDEIQEGLLPQYSITDKKSVDIASLQVSPNLYTKMIGDRYENEKYLELQQVSNTYYSYAIDPITYELQNNENQVAVLDNIIVYTEIFNNIDELNEYINQIINNDGINIEIKNDDGEVIDTYNFEIVGQDNDKKLILKEYYIKGEYNILVNNLPIKFKWEYFDPDGSNIYNFSIFNKSLYKIKFHYIIDEYKYNYIVNIVDEKQKNILINEYGYSPEIFNFVSEDSQLNDHIYYIQSSDHYKYVNTMNNKDVQDTPGLFWMKINNNITYVKQNDKNPYEQYLDNIENELISLSKRTPQNTKQLVNSYFEVTNKSSIYNMNELGNEISDILDNNTNNDFINYLQYDFTNPLIVGIYRLKYITKYYNEVVDDLFNIVTVITYNPNSKNETQKIYYGSSDGEIIEINNPNNHVTIYIQVNNQHPLIQEVDPITGNIVYKDLDTENITFEPLLEYNYNSYEPIYYNNLANQIIEPIEDISKQNNVLKIDNKVVYNDHDSYTKPIAKLYNEFFDVKYIIFNKNNNRTLADIGLNEENLIKLNELTADNNDFMTSVKNILQNTYEYNRMICEAKSWTELDKLSLKYDFYLMHDYEKWYVIYISRNTLDWQLSYNETNLSSYPDIYSYINDYDYERIIINKLKLRYSNVTLNAEDPEKLEALVRIEEQIDNFHPLIINPDGLPMIDESILDPSNIIYQDVADELIQLNLYNNKYKLSFVKASTRFLINRYKFVSKNGMNTFDNKDLIAARLVNNNRLSINLDISSKWNIKPMSISVNTPKEVHSNTEMVIFDFNNEEYTHKPGYYDIDLRYSLDNNTNQQFKNHTSILIKK